MASGAPPGCYLLLVLGQPCAQEHKDHILKKVEEGLLSWDVESTKCNLVGLETVCSSIDSSKEIESELLIQYSTENLAVEVLLNPHVSTLKQCLKNLLAANVGHKHVIHAGYAFTGSGSWVLQDGSFSHDDFVDTLQDVEVQRALRRHHGYTIHVHCIPEGPWAQQGEDEGALTKIYESLFINPAKQASVIPGSAILLNCLDSVLKFQPLTEMMKSSPVVGNIRFNRPTLYVFPGGQGDCALFGVSGFTMLIDGGFNRKPCFWEFIRHLDRLDAIMITRLNENNVCGITNVVRRKREGKRVYPQVGYVFCNVAEGKQSPTSPGSLDPDRDPLLVSVIQEGREFSENLQQLGLKPHRCLRDCQVEPLTLFHKVGHGTLEMYVLSPPKDSKEMKLFFQQWTSYKEHFSSRRYLEEREVPIPLSHAMSICALLVWKPADPADTITRVLLPGSAPQSKIFEGLEHLRHLEELKHRTCSQLSLGIKYEERVKVKTTKKHVIKTSTTKQKADIVRPSSPIKAAREGDEQMKLQRKRAESPIKLQISSPVRKVKRSTKKVEEKKTASTKDEIIIKKSISKDIKLVSKKIKKRTRSKEKRLISEEEKRDIGDGDEEIVEPLEDEIISVETESLPKIEDEKTKDVEPLKIEAVEPDLHEEEKILLETKEIDKELETVPEKEKEYVREPLESEKDKSPIQEIQPKTEKEISEPVETIQELPDTKTPIEEQKEVEHITSEPPVQDEVKTSPLPVEKTKTPSPEKEKDVELKITQQKVSKKKLVSKTTPSTRTALPSPDILRLRKEPEARKIPLKKEKVTEKESRVKPTTKTIKSISKPTGAQSPIERTPTPPSKFTAKTKEPTKPRTIKASPPVRTAPKIDMKSIKIPSVSEIKSKTAKDVVNKRVAESKVLAKQLELVKSKSPATPPKSPMKKPKEKLPIASPKKKPKMPTTAPTRISKPSKDKVKPKPVKRPEKIKEIIPSGSEEIKKDEQEEKGPIKPDEEHIPSQLSTPVEKTVEEMVQSVPSSPKDIQPEIEDFTQDVIDKTPSEVLEKVEETPVISEPKEIETPEEKAKETEIYDEQMVVKEIEAVEAAVDELIEGMRTEIEEAKVKIPSDADDSLQITEQERQDIEPQEKEEIAILKEDIGAPSGEGESAIEDLSKLDLTQEMDTTILNKLKETLRPFIQEELSFINDYIENEGVTVKDSEKIIFEVTFEVLRKIQDTLPIERATKYINERKVEIASIVCSKHKIEEDISKPIQKESEAVSSKTPSPEEEIVEEITTPEKSHINVDQYQTPESKIEISTLANEIKKETKVENLEDIIAQVVCECLQSKAITLTKETFKNFIVEYKTEIITIILKKYLPKIAVEKDEELKEKEELTKTEVPITKEEEKPTYESIKKCLTAKGKEEINKLLEDIKREGIAKDDLENIIYEIISSDIQKKNLTVKEDIIILYIIEYRTEIINKIKSKYVTVLKEEEEKEITEPEVITVNIEQYLSPESKIEISSLANEVKKEIDIDNLEQTIAEVVYECLQNNSIVPTKETFTKYIVEYRVEIITIIRKKYTHGRIQKEVEMPSEEEAAPTEEEEVPTEKKELLVEEKIPKQDEQVSSEKEEVVSTQEHIPEEKEKAPKVKEELLDEVKKIPKEDEHVPKKKEIPSEEGHIPEEIEEIPTEKEVSIKEEEKPSPESIKKSLSAKGKEEINKLLEDIKREEYRTEIINKIKSKYVPVLKEAKEKEITEPEVIPVKIEQYLSPESKIEISSLANEVKKEIDIDNLEQTIAEVVYECLQNKSIIPTKETFTKYIVEYRVEIITIIRKKYTHERIEKEEEIPFEKEEASTEREAVPSEKKELLVEEKVPKQEEQVPSEKDEITSEEHMPEEKVPTEKKELLDLEKKISEEFEKVPEGKEETPSEEVHIPEVKDKVPSEKEELLTEKEKVPEKDEKLPSEKEEISSEDMEITEIKEKVPIEKTEILDEEEKVPIEEEKVPIEEEKVPIEEEKILIEKEEIPSEEVQIPEEKVPSEKKDLFDEDEKVHKEDEKVPSEKEKTPSQEVQITEVKEKLPIQKEELLGEKEKLPLKDERVPSEKEEIPSKEVHIPVEKDEVPTLKDVSILVEETPSPDSIKKCLSTKGKEEINKLIEDIKREGIVHDDLENIIYEIISSDIQKKSLTVKEDIIILYIIEYRTEIINKIKSKYVPVLKEAKEKEITEPEVIPVKVEQYLSPESKIEISSLANEVKKEIDIDNLEQTIAEVVYECLQNKSIIPTKETFTKYIVEYRVEIITIIRKKYTHERIEKEEEIPFEKEEASTEREAVPSEKKELLVEEKVPKQEEQVPSEKDEITSEEHMPEEKVPTEKKEVLDLEKKISEEFEKVPEGKEETPSEEVHIPEVKDKVPSEKEELLTEKEKVPEKDEKLPSEKEEISSEDMEITEIKEKVPIEKTEILDEEEKVPIEEKKVLIEKEEIPSEEVQIPEEKVPSEKKDLLVEKERVHKEDENVPSEKEEIPSAEVHIPEEKEKMPTDKDVLIQEEKEKPTYESIKKCLTAKGKEEVNKLLEDIKREGIAQDDLENIIYEIISSDIQKKNLTVKEDIIILYIIEYRTEIINKIKSNYVPVLKEEEEIEITEPEVITVNIEQYLSPESKIEISSLANEVKKEINIDNLEQTIAEVIYECLQNKSIIPTKQTFTKYIVEYRVEIITMIRKKYSHRHIEKEKFPTEEEKVPKEKKELLVEEKMSKQDEQVSSEKEEVTSEEEQIPEEKEKLPSEKKALLDEMGKVPKEDKEVTSEKEKIPSEEVQVPGEKEVPIEKKEILDEEEKIPSKIEEVSIEELQTPEDKIKIPSEKKELFDEEKKIPKEDENVPSEKEKIPSEAVLMPEVEEEKIPSQKEKPLTKKEILSLLLNKRCLTSRGQKVINELIEDIKIENVPSDVIENALYEILASNLEKKEVSITEDVIILYILEYRTEIISQIQEKYVTFVQEPVKDLIISEESVEEKTHLANIMECITPEVRNVINDLAKNIQVEEEMLESTIEIILQTLSEEMQRMNVSVESNSIVKYVLLHKKEITDIVQNKLTIEEEIEKVVPVSEKITEIEIQEAEEAKDIAHKSKERTPSPADDIEVPERETPQIIDELLTEKGKTSAFTKETEESPQVTEKITAIEIQQPAEKDTISKDLKQKIPSPIDETKAIEKEKIDVLIKQKEEEIPSPTEKIEQASPTAEEIIAVKMKESEEKETVIVDLKKKTPIPVEDTKEIVLGKEIPEIIDETLIQIEQEISSAAEEIQRTLPPAEQRTTIETQEKEVKEDLPVDFKKKTPSPVDETKKTPEEKKTPETLHEIIKDKVEEISSPTEKTEKVSPVVEKLTQELEHKEGIAEDKKKRTLTPAEEIKEITPGIPVTEKVKEMEIQEPAKKETITEDQKTKTPSPIEETKAEPKERDPSQVIDEDKKIPSPTAETEIISPVSEKITELEVQEPTGKEIITENQKTKTPSPVEEAKAEPKEKEPSPAIDEHITKKEDKKIPSSTEKTEQISPVAEIVTEFEIQETTKKQIIAEGQKTKTPSPVDEIKEEPKEKEPSPIIDDHITKKEDQKIPSPTKEIECISPLAEKVTELDIQELAEKETICEGQKTKTPSPVDEIKAVLNEKETPQVIEEHITLKEEKQIPSPTVETEIISPVTEKIETMEIQEPIEKETITADQKTKTPSPIDDTEAEPKEKEPFSMIDEDKKIPSTTAETEIISPVTGKITEIEIQEPTKKEAIIEDQTTKTPLPVDETKAERKVKEPQLVIDEHIAKKEDKKIPSPTEETEQISPVADKATELKMQDLPKQEIIAEGFKTKTPSPVYETRAEHVEKQPSPVIDEDKKIASPTEETESISPVAEKITEPEIQEIVQKEVIEKDEKMKTPSPVDETVAEPKEKQPSPVIEEDKKIPSPTEETEEILTVAEKVTELEIQEPAQKEDLTKGQKSKTSSPDDESKAVLKEKETPQVIEELITEKEDKKFSSPVEEMHIISKVTEKVTEKEIKEPVEKEAITEYQKTKTPSPVDETKAEPKEKEPTTLIGEHITMKEDKKIPSPTKESDQISPVGDKVAELEMQEPAEKEAIAEGQKTKTPSPVDQTIAKPRGKQASPVIDEDKKIPSPTEETVSILPDAEKIAEPEIQEIVQKEVITKDEKMKIPSPVDETKAVPKEKETPQEIDKHITQKEDKKIPSSVKETERISPVTEKVTEKEIQEPSETESIIEDQKMKTPSPVDETKAEPKEKEPSPVTDEHITEKVDKMIPSRTEETKRISPLAEKVTELEKQELAEKETISESQKTETKSPVDESKAEPKEKEPSALIDEHMIVKEDKKIPSPTEETEQILPVAEKVAELRLQEPAEKDAITEGQKTKTPTTVDETKAEPKEKEPSPVTVVHATKKDDKKIPSPTEETERISPLAEKVMELEMQESEEKEVIAEGQKTKTPSPVDETKAKPKEKQPSLVIDEDEKIPSPTAETEIQEPTVEEAITEDEITKTPSPVEETKVEPKEKEPPPVTNEHITEKEDKKIPSPLEETKQISPLAEKLTDLEKQEPAEKEAISEGRKAKTPSPIDETKAVPKEKEPSPVIDEHITPKEYKSTPADVAKIISSETEDKEISKKKEEIVPKTKEEETKSPTVEEIEEKAPFIEMKLDSVSPKKDVFPKDTNLASPIKVPIELDAAQAHEDILKYLTLESRIEMSSLADEIKTEIDIDNLEEIIAEVVYNCLQIKSITLTKENFTKYIIENRIEIITIIRKKYICEYIEEQKIPSDKEEIVSYEKKISPSDEKRKETESLQKEDIVIKDKLGKHTPIEEDKDLAISKDKTKDTKLFSPETDSDFKVMQEAFLKEVSHRIENYDKLLKELDDECLFPSGSSADVLYNTACSEMNRKGVIISIEGIIKYIAEYKIEIITMIKTKYSKRTLVVSDTKFAVETETSDYKLEKKVTGKETFPVSSDLDMDASAFIQTYDEDIFSPMAESVMGEEIEIHEEQAVFESDSVIKYETVKDLHVVEASKDRAETITPKTVYEKPEAEQVFRHIFAETIVDDEIEVLQDREDSSQISLKDEEEKEVPDAMKKKLMYVEIEIEESVTSTTDASPDTDAPEIPYDGKYKEIIDESLITESYTKESIDKLEEKDVSKIVQEVSEKDIESKPKDESVSSASGLVSEELSAKELKIETDTQELKMSKKEYKIISEVETKETSTSKIPEIQEQQILEEKVISTKDVQEIKLQESKPEETLEKSTEAELSESLAKDSKSKETIPETVPKEIKKEETSFVLSTSDSPSATEISKLLIKTNVIEDDSSISETVTKISSSKIVSSEIDEDTFTTVTKTEKDEDEFKSITTITTTTLIKSGDSIKEEKLTSKRSEKDAIPPTELKSPISEVSQFSTEESQDIVSSKIKTTKDSTKIEDSVMKSAQYTEHGYTLPTTEVMTEISKSDEGKTSQCPKDALVESATSEFESTIKIITAKKPSKTDELKEETFLEEKPPEVIKTEETSQLKQEVQIQTRTEYSSQMQEDEEHRITQETDVAPTIEKTVTTITRKIVVPSDQTEETSLHKDDKQATTPKSISPIKFPHVEDDQIKEEIDESDGTSTITKTITTVTRKIVVPSADAEEVVIITKDDQTSSGQKSEPLSKTSEVDYQKPLIPKSASPSMTPDGDDIHVTEETEESDGTSTITKTVTTITRKIIVPSEDIESETTFEKDDKHVSTPKGISPSQSPDVEDAQIKEEIDESDGTSTITKTVTTVKREIVEPTEDAEEVVTITKDDQKPSGQESEPSSKTSEVDYQKSLSPKSVSPSMTPDGDNIHVTEETEESDGTSTITKMVTTITRKVVLPSEDIESETTSEKDDKQVSTPKSVSPSKSPDVEDAQVKEEMDEIEDAQIKEEIDESVGTSTITKTITTVTRKIVVPSEDAEGVVTITKDDQKPSGQKSESSSKTSEVDYQKSLSPKSVSPSMTPDGDDIHVTEETEESDGTSTITKTVTTITRKIIVPSEHIESETTFEKDDKQVSTPKIVSPSKSPDVEDAQIKEEIDESDGTSTITKTVTTVTRKIVEPSEDAEEVVSITKDDQKPSGQKSESSSKTSEVDYQKSLSPKTASPSMTPDGDDIHVTEQTEERDGTSTITKTVTTITRKIIVPSDDIESETTFEKDDKHVSTPKGISHHNPLMWKMLK
ncbi:microtubule-associated protein futsch [Trichonephila clavata]|uniref:Microtubule-associated protein futsch n=1 Tax=Trichonephila clavata TaxID=2740835 RepID=A0A8X6GG18_TRICU|nr:microtubule-associated protein futsch [Trichonephila clavata]